MTILIKSIGLRIAKARKMAGFRQLDIASKLNLSRSLIAQIEKGRSMPTLDFLSKFIVIVGTTYHHILEEETKPKESDELNCHSHTEENLYLIKKYSESLEAQIKLHVENSLLKDELILYLRKSLSEHQEVRRSAN